MRKTMLLGLTAWLGISMSAVYAADDKVVIYSAAPQELVDKVVPAFEKASGLKVELVKAGAGELVNRVKAEKGRTAADVVWSVGGEVLQANPDLFQAYTPKDADKIVAEVRSKGKWTPFTVVATAFSVNTQLLSEAQRPKTWLDLAKPEYKGKISVARLDKSSSSYIQLAALLQIYGLDKGWDLYSKIMDNTQLATSSGAVPKFVNDGEAAIGLNNEDVALRFKNGGGPVDVIYPSDGTTAQADGMALLATPQNAKGAKLFMDFVISKDAQTAVASVGRRPVRADVPAAATLAPLTSMKLIAYDIEWAAGYQKAALARWNEIMLTK
jgi:iron(III) transport system substrate-binding protein